MDISKRDSRCNPRSRTGMEIAGSFSEQFSDSSSNHGELARVQNTNKAANSPCEDEKSSNFPKSESGSREADLDTLANSNGSSSALASPTSKKNLPKQSKAKTNSSSSSTSSVRDEKDIKKEDASLSPQNISPLGFGSSISGQPSGRENEDNTSVNKTSNLSPSPSEKNALFSRSGCNEMEERSSSASLAITGNASSNVDAGCGGILSNSMSPKCKTETDFGSNISNISNISRNLTSFNGNLAKFNCSIPPGDSGIPLNAAGGNSGSDYMQQQNHIFVFSTQLANKSAEAVLCGQFPTIIAYHCMQPTTKLFLEDFLKNPGKTTKLQRQYSLNIMNVMQSGTSGPSGGQPPYWLNECNNSGRIPSQRMPLRNVGGGGVNKNNPGWDSASVLDSQPCAANALDTLNNVEAATKGDDKSNIPSLQGVKVPDENLTPQQRQHREEQLAKLKKMNKFLFPENDGNDFHGPPPHSSASTTLEAGNSGDMLHNAVGHCSDGAANKICPPTMRNIAGNISKPGPQNIETIASIGGGDAIIPAEMLVGSAESPNMGLMQNLKHGNCMSKMNPSAVNNLNSMKPRQCDISNDQTVSGMENSPDMTTVGGFNMNNCPSSEAESVSGGPPDMIMSQTEWTKFQNNAFADGFKGGRQSNAVNPTGLSGGPLGCQQNSSLSRSLSTGVANYGGMQPRPNTGPSTTNRNNNGPPPPYHQTQRSASVPIATQSPTHASPNKPTADMPLPSPQASSRVQFGVSPTPQNTDISNSTSSACTTYVGPTSANVNSPAQVNPHNSSILNNIAANSPSSLSHISPRDLDCLEPGGHKSKMASPQKFKGGPVPGLMNDVPDIDSKYGNFGLGYPTCNMPPQAMRQSMQQMPPQFCRRIDNIPLNPNCNRVGQSKNANNFDPISSLTQMSQQLTGVGLSAIGSGSSGPGGLGVMDMNPSELMTGGSSMRGSSDPSLDHCNQLSNTNNMGMVGGLAGALGRVTGQFGPDMNNMLCGDTGPMDHRMLNGKMCVPNMPGNFGPNSALTGVGLRESAMACNDMSSSNRVMNRRGMPGTFDNFSMSPNIHVKVSTPNTIQYMPARSQNMNNMRVPPNIEFFQRYSNPQIMGNMVTGVGHQSGGPMPNDIVNPNVMNMFGNCTQMPPGVGQLGGNGNGGFDQNDLEAEGNVLPNNDYMNVPQ